MKPSDLPELGTWGRESGQPKVAKDCRKQYWSKESYISKESSRDMQMIPSNLQLSIYQLMHVKKLPKKHMKGSEEIAPEAPTGSIIVTVPIVQSVNLINREISGRILQKNTASVVGQN